MENVGTLPSVCAPIHIIVGNRERSIKDSNLVRLDNEGSSRIL